MTITIPLPVILFLVAWLIPSMMVFKAWHDEYDDWGVGALCAFIASVIWGLFDLVVLFAGAYFHWWVL